MIQSDSESPQFESKIDSEKSSDECFPIRSELGALKNTIVGDVLVGIVSLLVFHWHLVPLLNQGTPTGDDWADLLMFGHSYMGHGVAPGGMAYPPAMPIILEWLSHVRPFFRVTALLASVASVFPYIGSYLAFRSMKNNLVTAICLLPVLFSSIVAEQTSYGGVAAVFAIGFVPIALVKFTQLLRSQSKVGTLVFSVCLFAIASLSHFIFFVCVLSMIVSVIFETCLYRRTFYMRLSASKTQLLTASIPLLVLVPIYVRLVATFSFGGASSKSGVLSLTQKFTHYVFREAPFFWMALAVISLALPVLVVRDRRNSWSAFGVAMTGFVYAIVPLSILVPNDRFADLLPIAISGAFALVAGSICSLPKSRAVFVALTIGGMIFAVNLDFELKNSIAYYPQQVAYYGNLSASVSDMQVFNWINSHTSTTSEFVTPPVGTIDTPIGWWVEGYDNRADLVGSAPQWLYFKSQQIQAEQSASILAEFPSDASIAEAHSLGVNYILLFRGWTGFNIQKIYAYVVSHPGSLVYHNFGAYLIKI